MERRETDGLLTVMIAFENPLPPFVVMEEAAYSDFLELFDCHAIYHSKALLFVVERGLVVRWLRLNWHVANSDKRHSMASVSFSSAIEFSNRPSASAASAR